MIMEKINVLKEKLENEILKKASYDDIYETSVEIDKLLVSYYRDFESKRTGLSC